MVKSVFDILLESWGCRNAVSAPDSILVPTRVLEGLAKLALLRQTFDENDYLSENPDIREAVEKGQFKSGWQHFIWAGLREGRQASDAKVDISRYVELNPDLKENAGLKSDKSLEEHWLSVGWLEGRSWK